MAIQPIPQREDVSRKPKQRPKVLTGSRIICESLLSLGVDVIFGYPGGAVLPLYHAIPEYEDLRHVLVRHEQGAVFAASGYARATGRVGVCLGTSGPGATNMMTGIADANLDSVPMVALTGQVAIPMIGRDAFQEVDTIGISLPITKHSYSVTDPADLPRILREAFYIAGTGRPGPVLVDIPRDVQQQEAEFKWDDEMRLRGYRPTMYGNIKQIRQAAKLIKEATRPLIVAGHGTIISQAYDELKELVETTNIPVVTTIHGISSIPESHELNFGMLGMHGSAYANRAVVECDLLVGIGMRFDDRVTGKVSGFAPNAKIIHIEIDPAEIGKNVKVTVPIVGDVRNILSVLNKEVEPGDHSNWVDQICEWRREIPMTEVREAEELLPQYVIQRLYEVTGGDAIVAADVGQHQMWVGQLWWFDKRNSFVSSGGLGSMGYSLPASMGIQIGRPDEAVWCVIGDGSIQITMQELGTIVQEKLPVKIAIINNFALGMVRQWQEFFYEKRYSHSLMGQPDFVKLGEAYGIESVCVKTKEEVEPAIRQAIAHDGPFIIDFQVAVEESVFPMIPPGGALSDIMTEAAG